jgi:hypothetical protein
LSANFWCWAPALALVPSSPDFLHRVDGLHDAPFKPPAHAIVEFVNGLTKKYPDLNGSNNSPWADGPMIGDANGEFIDFSIQWDAYEHVIPFILLTARKAGLDCFDPQNNRYFPIAGNVRVVIPPGGGRTPVTNSTEAIDKARHVCRLDDVAPDQKHWHASLIKNPKFGDEWHVWAGDQPDPSCGSYGADVSADGYSTACSVSLCKQLPPKSK